MQDRFKFRVLDTEINKLYPCIDSLSLEEPNAHFLLAQDGTIVKKYYNNGEIQLIRMNIYKPIFCTSLKDKNGKLIYEGDVVKYFCPAEYCSDGLHKCPECYSGENGSVHYDEDLAMYEYRSKSDKCPLTDNINTEEDLEIIGNIYENPELILEDKCKYCSVEAQAMVHRCPECKYNPELLKDGE